MTTPGQTLGVSVFLDYIIDDLQISRSFTSLFYTLGTLSGSLILPFVGRGIDKKGPRTAAVVISLLFSAACIWMGFIIGPISLLIGFILIRGFGQGSLSLVSNYVVNIWFIRYRGLAVGLSGLGFAIAAGFFPYLIPRHSIGPLFFLLQSPLLRYV
ncbi:MAG: MFS transporter [Spirochaetaceae bacterium]